MGSPMYYFALIVAILGYTCHGHADHISMNEHDFNPIRLNRPDSNGQNICLAWRLGVEANNIRNWSTVFRPCRKHVRNYMLNGQYTVDLEFALLPAEVYVQRNKAASDNDVWIFDLDEGLLSDLPYYSRPDVDFGGKPYNKDNFQEWIAGGKLPAIPTVQSLYNLVLGAGYKIVIISGTPEKYRDVRIENLNKVGYENWSLLILRKEEERGIPAVTYKSSKRAELVKKGYRIVGSVGDQWSDLLGPNPAEQNFKLPNPMYYVP